MPTQSHTGQKRASGATGNFNMGVNDAVIDEADGAETSNVFRTPQNRRSRTRRGNGEGDPHAMRSGG